MDLTPAEGAVLRQVRDLFREASVRSYRVTSLAARWPAAHRAAYEGGFAGLVRKGLLVHRPGEPLFGISTAALKAMA
jgi:hypothetical protein